ncbi:MAG: SBBP repeat-containing protein, partial [Deltaproteobacteria bacterium]|nr:SBBP repeat-containing protein [Deltaproteobacteria bacterium]
MRSSDCFHRHELWLALSITMVLMGGCVRFGFGEDDLTPTETADSRVADSRVADSRVVDSGPVSDLNVDGPQILPDQTLDGPQAPPDQTIDAPQALPDQTIDAPQALPDQTIDAPQALPDQTIDAPQALPDQTIDAPQALPDQTIDAPQPAVEPLHTWSQRFGTIGLNKGYAIVVDASDNITITGRFYGTVNFGGKDLSATSDDLFLVSYTSTGAHRWSKSFNAYGASLTVDTLGNVTLVGSFLSGTGGVSFGGEAFYSSFSDAYVASFDSRGKYRWSRQLGGARNDRSQGVAADVNGNVTVTGDFYDTVDFGGGDLSTSGIYGDVFVASYDSSGAHRWSKRFGADGSTLGVGVAVDGDSNVNIIGTFDSNVNFGGSTLNSAGLTDVFVASYSSTGAHRWSKSFGSSAREYGRAIAVDASGNVTTSGSFSDTVSFGGSALTSAGGYDIFLASYNVDGAHRWSKSFGGTLVDSGKGLATNASGDV